MDGWMDGNCQIYAPPELDFIHQSSNGPPWLSPFFYIPPPANAKLALEELYSRQMNSNPEAAVIVAGDFNHVELKAVLPKLKKFIHFPTRDRNILDEVYCNTPGAYKAAAAPHLGMSDHISVELTPAYKPKQFRYGLRRLVQHYRTVLN